VTASTDAVRRAPDAHRAATMKFSRPIPPELENTMTRRLSLPTRLRRDDGAATAEYAITIMAAVGFAGLLVVILKSGEVQGILTDLVRSALTVGG
jgi:hypothetical protein